MFTENAYGIFQEPLYENPDPFEPGPIISCPGLFGGGYSSKFRELCLIKEVETVIELAKTDKTNLDYGEF